MSDNNLLGTIFNIQRFSLHDGPGIRTLVFLKGCPLRCLWCANPEGLKSMGEIKYEKSRCRYCDACIHACPSNAIKRVDNKYITDEKLCTYCGKCIDLCFAGARQMTAKKVTVDEIIDKIKRDMKFYDHSTGGVTLGGGEPLLQGQFAKAVLEKCKQEGIHTAIETSAYVSFDTLEMAARLCDTVYIDIKAFDDQLHKSLTGVNNGLILDNITRLDKMIKNGELTCELMIRMPVIPPLNNSEENISKIGKFVLTLSSVSRLELLPFHNFGESKYEQLNYEYTLKDEENMSPEDIGFSLDILRNMGVNAMVNTW